MNEGARLPTGPHSDRRDSDQHQDKASPRLDHVLATFSRWLGESYDVDALLAVLATAACDQLEGDPPWMLLISGSGATKTETVRSLAQVPYTHVISTIASEGALLSATPIKEQSKAATGGLMRKVGRRGIVVIKDVTTILEMDRRMRGTVMAALREIADGSWVRNVGVDGGKSLVWEGRIICIGACTSAWDRAHDVIAQMGNRFVIFRTDSSRGRVSAGRLAIGNTGDEERMRTELAESVAAVLKIDADSEALTPTEAERERLLRAADLVTRIRTGVDYDYRGDVIDCHALEMPTRFAKQLTQIMRGAVAIGVERERALALALRGARDSVPPLRLAALRDVAGYPGSITADVTKRLDKPRTTVDRTLQALHILGVLTRRDDDRWRYSVAAGMDPGVLGRPPARPDPGGDLADVGVDLADPFDLEAEAPW